ncbi:MAG: ABC transporter permease [Pseudomonadota bacterium]
MYWQYVLRRVLLTVPTLLIASTLVFMVVRLLPGDPALLIVSDAQDPVLLEATRERLGLNKPLIVQYALWLRQMVGLDMGVSISTGLPVAELIGTRFAVTARIVTIACLVALLLAVPLGLLAAARHNRALDRGVMMASILLLSVPSFWVALLLILLFGVTLRWLPTVGYVSPSEDLLLALKFAVMPVLALCLTVIGQLARMMRSTSLDVLASDYILFARAKGLSEQAVLGRHALPNALAPTLTVAGMIFGALLGGAAVIETIFTIPGIGRLLVDSIYARDYPVIQGSVLLVGFVYIMVNLAVDLLHPLLDPRVEY